MTQCDDLLSSVVTFCSGLSCAMCKVVLPVDFRFALDLWDCHLVLCTCLCSTFAASWVSGLQRCLSCFFQATFRYSSAAGVRGVTCLTNPPKPHVGSRMAEPRQSVCRGLTFSMGHVVSSRGGALPLSRMVTWVPLLCGLLLAVMSKFRLVVDRSELDVQASVW